MIVTEQADQMERDLRDDQDRRDARTPSRHRQEGSQMADRHWTTRPCMTALVSQY